MSGAGLSLYGGAMTKFLHTMIRVSDPAATIAFFKLIGLDEVRRYESQQGRFTLIFRKTPDGWKIVHDHTSAAEGG